MGSSVLGSSRILAILVLLNVMSLQMKSGNGVAETSRLFFNKSLVNLAGEMPVQKKKKKSLLPLNYFCQTGMSFLYSCS